MTQPVNRLALLAAVLTLTTAAGRGDTPPNPPLGLNLGGVTDYSSELVFVDAFKAARAWISQAKGKPWGKGGPLDVDSRGNVRALADGQFAETVVWTGFEDRYPAGRFVCLYDGNGDVDIVSDARVTERQPGRLEVEVKPRSGSAFLRITRTDPKDPVRNIRLVPVEREKTYRDRPFRDDFLRRWRGFRVFRFMDWQRTNGSPLVEWADRPTPTDHSQAIKGVALEYMIDLCNTLKVDPWFCLPHRASDDFVRQFAAMVKERLDPARTVYIEYSNECWNGQFAQARYCAEQGRKLGLSTNAFEAQLRYYSKRSVEIFAIWEDVFGGKKRLVRVLATQSANPWTGTTVLDWKSAHRHADAVAIAPYFGHHFGSPKTAEQVAEMSTDALVETLAKDVAANVKIVRSYAEVARKRGVQLVAYEGGQHLAGFHGAENNDRLTRLFHAANRHPRMKDLYLTDLHNWRDAGGGLYCVFSSMGTYSKWGSWGVLEHMAQDPKRVPKMQAIEQFLAESARR
ncbi:MAG: hypothetical protein U0736_22220 [Gemmataceae bacterium]